MSFVSTVIAEMPRKSSLARDLVISLGMSVVIALFAPISIPLPFTPVPIGTQAQVVLLLSVLLGSRRAVMAVFFYLVQGMIGFPVFSGGIGGVLHFVGPRGGYLLGYLVAAWVTGWIVENGKKGMPLQAFRAMLAGNLVIYFCGVAWLSSFVGWKNACLLGVVPFVVGDFLKILVATKFLKKTAYVSGKR